MNSLRNKVTLIGRLGAQPEITKLESGQQLVKISLATNERYKDKAGEWTDLTQWHSVVAWNRQAEMAEKMLTKGTEIIIEGRLVNRSYETRTGEKRYATEVEMNGFLIMNSKQAN